MFGKKTFIYDEDAIYLFCVRRTPYFSLHGNKFLARQKIAAIRFDLKLHVEFYVFTLAQNFYNNIK